ncbi:DUF3253 domain-containing protein [Roseivivax sp. CAU 1761]
MTAERPAPRDAEIAAALMRLARARGPDKTFCPSEVARALAAEWRPLMPEMRRVAAGLPLVATQRGRPVDPETARGPIRLALAPGAGPAAQSRRGERG